MSRRFLVLCLVIPIALACQSASDHASHDHADWSYEGATGPDHWGDLDPDYALAKTGREQSPINIETGGVTEESRPEIVVDYHPTTLDIINNGHTLQDNYTGGGSIEIDGHRYELAQFHVHAPSEHTIDGRHAAAEMHFVHTDEDDNLAVIAVMIVEGAQNAFVERVRRYVPREPGRASHVEGMLVDASELLPSNLASYRYAGSLTTPPCSEGVRWIVLKEPIEASREQLDQLRATIPKNNRPTQPLNDRKVVATE